MPAFNLGGLLLGYYMETYIGVETRTVARSLSEIDFDPCQGKAADCSEAEGYFY
jgi:hypothetical protein